MKAITPYLVFDGNCREAMTFYQQALGGGGQAESGGARVQGIGSRIC